MSFKTRDLLPGHRFRAPEDLAEASKFSGKEGEWDDWLVLDVATVDENDVRLIRQSCTRDVLLDQVVSGYHIIAVPRNDQEIEASCSG